MKNEGHLFYGGPYLQEQQIILKTQRDIFETLLKVLADHSGKRYESMKTRRMSNMAISEVETRVSKGSHIPEASLTGRKPVELEKPDLLLGSGSNNPATCISKVN